MEIIFCHRKRKTHSCSCFQHVFNVFNVDSKLASKVIASRVKKVLPRIIHHNQEGFIKGRFIGEATRSSLDIIDYTESFKLPGVLLFIDFEKAVDSKEWDFLYKSLEAFNFGPTLRRWIKTFYNNVSGCVINNRSFLQSFKLERGVRKWNPLSPYLFIVAIEILAIALRSNQHIEGRALKLIIVKLKRFYMLMI